MKAHNFTLRHAALFLTMMALGSAPAFAANGTWGVDASGNWSDDTNWVDSIIPDGAGSVVNLTNDITANRTITNAATPRTVGVLNMGATVVTNSRFYLRNSGGGYLQMDNSSSQAQINFTGGISEIYGEIRMTDDGLLIKNTGYNYGQLGLNGANDKIIVATNQVLTLATTGAPIYIYSAISGDGSVFVDSTGTGATARVYMGVSYLTNTFTGGTLIRQGKVMTTSDSAFGAGGVQLGASGATIAAQLLNSSGQARNISNNLTVSSASTQTLLIGTINANSQLTWHGDIDLQKTLWLYRDSGSGAITLTNGSISGAGGLELQGSSANTNNFYLASAGTYAGGVNVNVAKAVLNLGHAAALGTGTLTVNTAATEFTLDSSAGDLTLSTDNAILLRQNVTYRGTGGAHLNLGEGAVTLSTNRTITTMDGTLTIGGAIGGGSYTLTKAGSGTLALNGANTYTGITTVQDGTLRGTGSVAGDVEVQSGAVLAAGNSIGTFTADGSASFLSGSAFQFELNSTSGIFDQLVANGLSLDSNVDFSVADLGSGAWSGPSSFVVINNTSGSAVTGLFNGLNEGDSVAIGANTFKISYVGGSGNDVTLELIPEPATLFLATAGLGLTLLGRRRRRS